MFLSLATKTNKKVQQVTVSGLSISIFVYNSPLSFDKWSGPTEHFPPKHFPKFHSTPLPHIIISSLDLRLMVLKLSLIDANTPGKRNTLNQYQLKAIICRETS